jgi:hypothetical protein
MLDGLDDLTTKDKKEVKCHIGKKKRLSLVKKGRCASLKYGGLTVREFSATKSYKNISSEAKEKRKSSLRPFKPGNNTL